MAIWNPWHGCHKYSAGCVNCYVYRRDESIGKDAGVVSKTLDFDLPLKKKRNGDYKLQDSHVYCCMTSDFFLEDADKWRPEIWKMIKERQDISFSIITKRILRFEECMPSDWEDGYDNVCICSTCENQEETDRRMPYFLSLPIKQKEIICEPLLGPINLEKYLSTHQIRHVTCGGESGMNVRECRYEWILDIRDQCRRQNVSFYFKQTGANFVKDGKRYQVERKYQMSQAQKANISFDAKKTIL